MKLPCAMSILRSNSIAASVMCCEPANISSAAIMFDGADRRFHRVQPVWSEARRVRFLPRCKLQEELLGVAFIARECISAAQRREVLQSVQLPHHAHIRRRGRGSPVCACNARAAIAGLNADRDANRLAVPHRKRGRRQQFDD